MRIVTGFFERDDAMDAVRRLTEAGHRADDLSLLSSTAELPDALGAESEEAAVSGASIGAVTGGSLGALGNLIASTIPGLEAMFASGLITTAAGSAIGAYLGSIYSVRADRQAELEIEEELASGRLLLVVRVGDGDAEEARSTLIRHQGEHVEIHTVPEE